MLGATVRPQSTRLMRRLKVFIMVPVLWVRHMGEMPTRYSQEVETTQKFTGKVQKNQETLAKNLVQHPVNIKHFSQH